MATKLLTGFCRRCSIKCQFSSPRRFIASTKVFLAEQDKETHTGQMWQKDDVRMVRFVNREKQVNERFAIDLIASEPPQAANSRVVSCDGGGGALGHPKVYINLDQPGNHTCGYCGLRFYKDEQH